MNIVKYIGMDVHKAMTVIAVLNSDGKVLAEAITETKNQTIVDFIKGQRGMLHVVFEEGTQAAWLYDLIRPYVANVVVCDPRKIVKQGSKADKIDAKRLAELLRTKTLTAVYHGEQSTRAVKELARSYSGLVQDGTRIKNRLKALFRARGSIATAAQFTVRMNEKAGWHCSRTRRCEGEPADYWNNWIALSTYGRKQKRISFRKHGNTVPSRFCKASLASVPYVPP